MFARLLSVHGFMVRGIVAVVNLMTVRRQALGWLAIALVVLLWPVGTALAVPTPSPIVQPSPSPTSMPSPTARPIMGPRATLVAFSDQDPWILELSGFDPAEIESVTYFVRDAGKHWHSLAPVTMAPFTAELGWWTLDSGELVLVTSHVQMRMAGKTSLVKDPGGWTSIESRRINPGGHLETLANADGTLSARYTPERAGTRIAAVQFWLRVAGRWNQVAEVSQPGATGAFEVSSIVGTKSGSWKSEDTAMSVHVVWLGGREWVDPVPWAWRDHFTTSPIPVPTPAASPRATPPATAAPPAATSATAAPIPPRAAPAGCYPLSNSGTCYEPGEFCRTSDHGRTGRAGNGEAIICRYNNGWRWEPA